MAKGPDAKGKRKHRLVIEVTYSHKVSEHAAISGLNLHLRDGKAFYALHDNPIWATQPEVYVDKLHVKSHRLVNQGLRVQARKRRTQRLVESTGMRTKRS